MASTTKRFLASLSLFVLCFPSTCCYISTKHDSWRSRSLGSRTWSSRRTNRGTTLLADVPRSSSDDITGVKSTDDSLVKELEQEPPPTSMQKFLIHKGRSAAMIRRSPSILGITLYEGWTDRATTAFCQAVQEVVRLNPILSGHVYNANLQKELWIQSGTFPPETHNFVRMLDTPAGAPDFASMDAAATLETITRDFVPLLGTCETTVVQIQKKLPLLEASLMVLPGSYALFSLKVSHSVGDGATAFGILKQISMLMSGLPVPPMQWDNPLKATHELYPPTMTQRDIEISYGAPFFIGALKNILTSRRTPTVLLLEKNKISAKKRELREQLGRNSISSNDVITAAFCQSNGSSDMFVFTENVRGIIEGIPRNAGGNFLWEIPLTRDVSSKPDAVRKAVESFGNGGYEGLPLQPFLCGRVCRVTSLATIAEQVLFEETKMVCTIPSLSFMRDIPLDVAVIFRYSKQYWGVMHNSGSFKNSGLLEDVVYRPEKGAQDVPN